MSPCIIWIPNIHNLDVNQLNYFFFCYECSKSPVSFIVQMYDIYKSFKFLAALFLRWDCFNIYTLDYICLSSHPLISPNWRGVIEIVIFSNYTQARGAFFPPFSFKPTIVNVESQFYGTFNFVFKNNVFINYILRLLLLLLF
jgi:hypothetical protein